MSIVVLGMDYPDNCEECKIKSWDIEDYVCPFSGVSTLSIGRQTNCPLRPLPDVHGDLVDISQEVNIEYFDDMNQEWSWKAGTVADALVVCEEFPMTIVEAEGE